MQSSEEAETSDLEALQEEEFRQLREKRVAATVEGRIPFFNFI